jgi:hypothetical protein
VTLAVDSLSSINLTNIIICYELDNRLQFSNLKYSSFTYTENTSKNTIGIIKKNRLAASNYFIYIDFIINFPNIFYGFCSSAVIFLSKKDQRQLFLQQKLFSEIFAIIKAFQDINSLAKCF